MPTMSAVAFGANRVALKSGVRARPAARRTAVAVHAAHDSEGDKIRARLASASLAAALVLAPVAVAPMPAFAEGCQSSCEAECLKIAPGSKDYCASACSDECSAMKEEGKSDEEIVEALGQHRARLQSSIGRQIRAKKTPILDFRADDALRSAERIDDILREDHRRRGEA